jgi:hypothetical protein
MHFSPCSYQSERYVKATRYRVNVADVKILSSYISLRLGEHKMNRHTVIPMVKEIHGTCGTADQA